MSNTIHSTSALHAAPVTAAMWVSPASTCAVLATSAAAAMWTKRNKGAAGAPGFWDPV
jgi:hypothetical protein